MKTPSFLKINCDPFSYPLEFKVLHYCLVRYQLKHCALVRIKAKFKSLT